MSSGMEAVAGFDIPSKMHRAKFGMWLFLASEVMFFSGFIGAFIALYNATPSAPEDARQLNGGLALINTIVLISSSLTMALAVGASKRGDRRQLPLFLILTVLCGLTFMVIKSFEYAGKWSHGLTPAASPFFSSYYLLTGFHGLHVLGGMIAIGYLIVCSFSGKFTQEYNIPVEVTGLYWHFVDIVWIFLFPMLYLLSPRGGPQF